MLFFHRLCNSAVSLVCLLLALSLAGGCSNPSENDSINESSLSQEELVFRYVGMGEAGKLDALLKSNPNLVNIAEDSYYNTPLHVAALNDDWDVVKVLLANGANPNLENINSEIPAETALQEAHVDMSKYLREVAEKAAQGQ